MNDWGDDDMGMGLDPKAKKKGAVGDDEDTELGDEAILDEDGLPEVDEEEDEMM